MNRAILPIVLLLLTLSGCKPETPPKPKAETAQKPVTQVDPATSGSIAGLVTFDGVAPAAQKIDMTQDPACTIENKTPLMSETYVVDHGHLDNVLVYVKDGLGDKAYAVPSRPVLIDQKGCRYLPHVAAAMVGQQVIVKNSDLAIHNVHSSSTENPAWNESQLPGGQDLTKTFAEPELFIPIRCNQHPWMKMYMNVLSNPFFAVTGPDGRFEISGLPPGEYTLAAVHEKLGEKDLKIKVAPKQQQTASFSFKQVDLKTAQAR